MSRTRDAGGDGRGAPREGGPDGAREDRQPHGAVDAVDAVDAGRAADTVDARGADTEGEDGAAAGGALPVNRRGFLQASGAAAGAGALVACTPGAGGPEVRREPPPQAGVEPGRAPGSPDRAVGPEGVTIELTVNGARQRLSVRTDTTLAEALRDRLDLTGLKIGCDRGACGACTVLLDGQAVASCMTLALDAHGRRVVTIEGLARGEVLHPLQEAFVQHDALQCGYCTSGMILSAKALLDGTGRPSEAEIREGLSGNLCRCGCYPNIFAAVDAAAKGRGGRG